MTMADEERNEEEEQARPRPRVVDKRISSRSAATAPTNDPVDREPAPPSPPEPDSAPPAAGSVPSTAAEAATGPEEPIWTPEQEAEAERMVEQISQVSSRDWVADAAIRLANVAGVKLDGGDRVEAQLAIDALAGLVNAVGDDLGEAQAPLRQMLAQLQMAFAQGVVPPP
ncbi:MAG: hypothetical protein M3516_06550 [Actinomycetota bacterium]|nr:hypothetical protein [Actinomycetota bacterium]